MDYNTWEPCEALYLDDMRPKPPDNHVFKWVLVKNYKEFCNYILQRGVPRFMSFDHDLALEHYAPSEHWGVGYDAWERAQDFKEKSGMDCARWLVEYCLDNDVPMPHFTVHSANPEGAQNILSLLNNLQKEQGQEPNGYRTAW
jgi:hypothetical protein